MKILDFQPYNILTNEKPLKAYSDSVYMTFPGSESIQFDLEKLFLLAVSKENLDLRNKIRKNVPYKIENKSMFLAYEFSISLFGAVRWTM